jgi:DNA topoisomerase-1
MVNEYIKNICCDEFTTKDFRTWMGTVYAIEAFKELGYGETEAEKKNKIIKALDTVAKRLGNTRAVCKKYYVHPAIPELYSTKELERFFDTTKRNNESKNFTEAESILIEILQRQVK